MEFFFENLSSEAEFIIKIACLALLALYIVFALVIVRQVIQMTDTLEVGFEKPIRAISVLHLIFALATFFIGLAIL